MWEFMKIANSSPGVSKKDIIPFGGITNDKVHGSNYDVRSIV